MAKQQYIDSINDLPIVAERAIKSESGRDISSTLKDISDTKQDSLGIDSSAGSTSKFLNQRGQWVTRTSIGPCGPQGACGPQGVCGPIGNQGRVGSCGPLGYCGPKGSTGPNGGTGSIGETGPRGYCGPLGNQGAKGFCGPSGSSGAKGETGPKGFCGPKGYTGPQGFCGPMGSSGSGGSAGETGNQGARGFCGPKGNQGNTGFCGPQGAKGFCGPMGGSGSTGDKGSAGPVIGHGVSTQFTETFNVGFVQGDNGVYTTTNTYTGLGRIFCYFYVTSSSSQNARGYVELLNGSTSVQTVYIRCPTPGSASGVLAYQNSSNATYKLKVTVTTGRITGGITFCFIRM